MWISGELPRFSGGGGIDVGTLYDLLHDHAEEAGCAVVSDLVESVTHADEDDGFVLERQVGRPVTARRVVAATRYGGAYLRGLDDEASMFVTHEHDGEEHGRFDRSYPAMDGTTPVEGVYVASPAGDADRQAITAAGHGARVGVTLVEDVRRERGYPDALADYYDWVRREAERRDEWTDRDRWREWFENRLPNDHGLTDERRIELREAEIDRRFETYLTREAVDRRTADGHDRLLDHIDDDRILERAREIDAERRSGG